jgi:hypothetical protein
MSENRKCWYCGSEPMVWHDDANLFAECPNEDCPNYGDNGFEALVLSVWNTRPLEDALQKEVDKLCVELNTNSTQISIQNDSIINMQKRIDELEAENKALRLIAGSHSMSELRRNQILAGDKWFKYPPAPERKEQ